VTPPPNPFDVVIAEIPRYLLVFSVVLLASLLLTPLLRVVGLRFGWTGRAAARNIHTRPTPRVGGIAIYLAFMLGLLLTYVLPIMRQPLDPATIPLDRPQVVTLLLGGLSFTVDPAWVELARFALLGLGATVVEAVMIWDDIRGIKPLPKLLWQLVAVALIVAPALGWMDGDGPILELRHRIGIIADSVQNPFGGSLVLPAALAVGFTFFWVVGMMNAINWSDGLDGLAGGITLVSCMVLFAVTIIPRGSFLPQPSIAYLPLILGAAVLGFLPYNWHPARIFMGDSGAMFLGFAVAVISIIGGAKIATALLVLGIPILDVAYVIIYRLTRRRSPFEADRAHLHYRLYDLGLNQRQIVLIYLLLCGGFGGLSFLPSALYKLIALAAMAVILLLFLLFIARRPFDRGRQPPTPPAEALPAPRAPASRAPEPHDTPVK
jgi:UDP-N-acetylmuramyl pentapeptide phosphotransferase/UDP-N-acetylglucosamine-1-phosphate transferase